MIKVTTPALMAVILLHQRTLLIIETVNMYLVIDKFDN